MQDRLDNALVSYALYLGKFFAPYNLCAIYLHPGKRSFESVAAAILVLGCVSWLAVKMRKSVPLFLFGWLFFLVTLLPTIGLVQVGVQAMADRYTYLPLLGIILASLLLLQRTLGGQCLPFVLPTAIALVLALCATLSFRQLGYWRDSFSLYERSLSVEPNNWVARLGLAMAFTEQSHFDEALIHLKKALSKNQNAAEVHKKYGICLYWKGDASAALSHWQTSLAENPSQPEIWFRLAGLYGGSWDPAVRSGALAVECAERGLRLKRSCSADEYLTLSAAYAEARRFSEAVRWVDRVISEAQNLADSSLLREGLKRRELYVQGEAFREAPRR